MRSSKNVDLVLSLLISMLLQASPLMAHADDGSTKKMKQFEERILKLASTKKPPQDNDLILRTVFADIAKELKSGSLDNASEIQWEGLKECMVKVEEGLKKQEPCEKIKSDIFLNYGNRSANADSLPQFAQTAVSISSRLCQKP